MVSGTSSFLRAFSAFKFDRWFPYFFFADYFFGTVNWDFVSRVTPGLFYWLVGVFVNAMVFCLFRCKLRFIFEVRTVGVPLGVFFGGVVLARVR